MQHWARFVKENNYIFSPRYCDCVPWSISRIILITNSLLCPIKISWEHPKNTSLIAKVHWSKFILSIISQRLECCLQFSRRTYKSYFIFIKFIEIQVNWKVNIAGIRNILSVIKTYNRFRKFDITWLFSHTQTSINGQCLTFTYTFWTPICVMFLHFLGNFDYNLFHLRFKLLKCWTTC